jgi:hypothetical protein
MWDEFPEELDDFANVLSRFEATADTSESLRQVAGYAQYSWREAKRVNTSGRGVQVPPPRNKAMHPRAGVPEAATMHFTFQLGDDFAEKLIPYQADFEVCVIGHLEGQNGYVELEDHWRVDSHVKGEIDEANEIHSYFHFQRGGHALDSFATSHLYVPNDSMPEAENGMWRASMQSPGPRIPMTPHCPILAIDFTIGQHDGAIWRALRSDTDYLGIIRRSQERLWTPFFNSLSDKKFRTQWLGPIIV